MTFINAHTLKELFRSEAAGGIILLAAAILAIICANTPLHYYYDMLLDTTVAIQIGAFEIQKPMLLWINDGLMAVFFFLIGLELKREFLDGELSDKRNIILPAIGAVGGMIGPALIYVAFNYKDPVALQGWAIPAATDIAFAIGVLALLGSRVPLSLKVFLVSLAIFDDIGAIIIIALFYTNNISLMALVICAACIPILLFMNRFGFESKALFIFVGLIMWTAMLKSGVHATLTGIVLAMFIPLTSKNNPNHSPLKELEHDLHGMVTFLILPIFAFANAGLNLTGIGAEQLLHNVPVGIALGLVLGNQLGIFTCCFIAIKLGIAQLPKGINWIQLYGTAALCGIGFTMSLFIGSLAFEETQVNLLFDERLGILVGSLISGAVGFTILKATLKESQYENNAPSTK